MSERNDGGPAFPVLDVHQDWDRDTDSWGGVQTAGSAGMSLRDYFAIHGDQPGQLEMAAEAGIVIREYCGLQWNDPKAMEFPSWADWFHKLSQEERYRLYAAVRYRIADAMLKERAK